jgi:hypothetical protein
MKVNLTNLFSLPLFLGALACGIPVQTYAATIASTQISSLEPSDDGASNRVKLPAPESETLIVVRDAGVGFGVGTLAGIGFILLSSGHMPNNMTGFDNEALLTGMMVGLGGGIVTGLWEVKRDRALRISVAPPTTGGASPTVGVTKSF